MQAFEAAISAKWGGVQSSKLSPDKLSEQYNNESAGTDISYVPVLRDGACGVAKSSAKKRCSGFTLVEVIVVIVIIAILAAIGVPALTGYIDKAQDKKYIMQARDAMIAMRAVIDEAYANGELAKNSSTNTSLDDYANSGVPSQYYNPEYNGNLLKYWDINNLSRFATNDPAKLKNSAIALSGSDYGQFYIIGPHDSSATDADGFFCRILPEGSAPGDPVIFVTYNMGWLYGGLESMDDYDFYADDEYYVWAELKDWGTYDPNAGYQIIHSSFVL